MIKQRLWTALLIGGVITTSVYAQADKGDSEDITQKVFELNPVVVTGTGTHQRLKNTPAPVSVITANEIKRAGITDFQQAMTMMVPSLSFSPNAMGSYLMMNGLSNKYVLILLNGRKMTGDISGNIDISQIDMSRVKRIEVLNGAASSLYGSDAIAGVINIITNQPKEEISFSSNSRYTGKNQFTQGLNLDIAKGKLGSYTAFKYDHSDGWQNSGLTESGDELIETLDQLSVGYNTNNFSQQFTYDATDKLSFYANGGYYWHMTDRPIEREGIDGGNKYNTHYEGYNWGTGAKYKLSNRNSIQLDYVGNNYTSRYNYMLASGDYLPGDYSFTKRQKFHDAELKGIFGFTTNSTTVFGIDYRQDILVRPDAEVDKGLYTLSGYGQHEVKLWDHLTGIVGLRYDHHEQAGGRFTPKVAAMYNIGNFNLRATYAAGFRAPGIDELYYSMFKKMGSKYTISIGDKDLKPEHSNYYSVNMEYRTNRFSASVTGYLNFLTDMVTSKTTPFNDLPAEQQAQLKDEFKELNDLSSTAKVNLKEYINFEKAAVRGFEVNLSGNPFAGFTLTGNYTYAYARGKGEEGWQNIQRSIRHTATLSGNYVHSWSDYTLNINLNGRLQSKCYYPGDVDGDAPGYGIWNLNTRHSFDCFRNLSLEPGIGIDNIFNKKDMRPLNKNFTLYSPGRMVVVSLALKLK
ncbi:TonB-dependent receptor [Bacteroides sp.]|uniref:TonB-dependent receptor plug domain-containing protein n=1 Tax=Bacteroides sp. TaxID=29523 RepID=UPI002604DCA2|nr:TonB-dependent receptor [Bacteroides sp.]